MANADNYLELSKHPISGKTTIQPDEIKSMHGLTNTQTSWPRNMNMPQNTHVICVNGKTYHINKTSSNIYLTSAEDHKKYGFATQMDDGSIGYSPFPNWLANGTQNKPVMNNYIPRISDIVQGDMLLYIQGITPLRIWLPNRTDPPALVYTTPRIVEAVDGIAMGRAVSLAENTRQKLRTGVLFNDTNHFHYEVSRFYEFVQKEGLALKKNPVLGIGVTSQDNAYARMFTENDYLVTNEYFHQMAKHWISRYGLTESEAVEAMERAILFHELNHSFGIGGSNRDEVQQGRLQAKFYSQLASESKGTRLEKIYSAIAQAGRDYATYYSLLSTAWGEITKDPSHHEIDFRDIAYHKFYHEGIAMGKEGADLENYITGRFKATFAPIYPNDAFDLELSADKTRQKTESIDDLVEDSDKFAITTDQNGIRRLTYDGIPVHGEGASMPTSLIMSGIRNYNNKKSKTKSANARQADKKTYETVEKREYVSGANNKKEHSRSSSGARNAESVEEPTSDAADSREASNSKQSEATDSEASAT